MLQLSYSFIFYSLLAPNGIPFLKAIVPEFIVHKDSIRELRNINFQFLSALILGHLRITHLEVTCEKHYLYLMGFYRTQFYLYGCCSLTEKVKDLLKYLIIHQQQTFFTHTTKKKTQKTNTWKL